MKRASVLMAAAALAAGATIAAPAPVSAAGITKAQLAGSWAATLVGNTGCGVTTLYVVFTLNSAGAGSARTQMHSSGCTDAITSGNVFTIVSVNSTGAGIATLTCGSECGWSFKIQVDSGLRLFSLVDVADLSNFLQGVSIHQ